MIVILGISAFYHDSAAALIVDGILVAAAQEERFTRIKNDNSFPVNAIQYVIQEAKVNGADISSIAFYEKPFLKFERILETYYSYAPRGIKSFLASMPLWIKSKLYIKQQILKQLHQMGISATLFFPEHHLSHAASAFYPSPFEDACILTIDGVGEWSTTTIGKGEGNRISCLRKIFYPHSLGLLYSTVTSYCGFRINDGEYKLMGLASYGESTNQTSNLISKIKNNLIDIKDDGSFILNDKYFNYNTGLQMANIKLWSKLFGMPPRSPESELTQDYVDLAFAAQKIAEEIIIKLAKTAKQITGKENLVMAGGVALNCVANGKLAETNLFKNIWIQPASGDAGGAIGAAFAVWNISMNRSRDSIGIDKMNNSYLGPAFSDKEIDKLLRKLLIPYEYIESIKLSKIIAELLAQGNTVGWFQDRMEFGPRALGNRSILADARIPNMQQILNIQIKNREDFRPFAPCILEEDCHFYFKANQISPYMSFAFELNDELRFKLPEEYMELGLRNKLNTPRSLIQAVVHVDFTSRIQTVNKNNNEKLYRLLKDFKELTGCSLLINTSFNVRDEPIVCTPKDAFDCFLRTNLNYLVLGNYLIQKKNIDISKYINT